MRLSDSDSTLGKCGPRVQYLASSTVTPAFVTNTSTTRQVGGVFTSHLPFTHEFVVTSMHASHGRLEQELLNLTIRATTIVTSKPATISDRALAFTVNHVSHIESIADQFVKQFYPYALFLAFSTMTSFFVSWALWEKMTFVCVSTKYSDFMN